MHRSTEQTLFSHTLIIIVSSTESSQTAPAIFLALPAGAQSLLGFSLLVAIWVVCERRLTCGTLNLENNDSKCLVKLLCLARYSPGSYSYTLYFPSTTQHYYTSQLHFTSILPFLRKTQMGYLYLVGGWGGIAIISLRLI